MTNLLHRIKYKFSEPYRIRAGGGLSPIRNDREMRALIAFCQEELRDRKHMKLNPAMGDVYRETVGLYYGGNSGELYQYILSHVDWYWS